MMKTEELVTKISNLFNIIFDLNNKSNKKQGPILITSKIDFDNNKKICYYEYVKETCIK